MAVLISLWHQTSPAQQPVLPAKPPWFLYTYIEGFFFLESYSGSIYVYIKSYIYSLYNYIEGNTPSYPGRFFMVFLGRAHCTTAFLGSAKVTHQFCEQRILAGAWVSRCVGSSYLQKLEVASGRNEMRYRRISTTVCLIENPFYPTLFIFWG